MSDLSINQRKEFANFLFKEMKSNKDIWLISVDLGYGLWDEHFKEFPERTINTGASECAAMDLAVGLALENKIPFVYSITPFLIYRGWEALRTYIDHENISVKLIGSGRDNQYHIDGYSHNATDIPKILSTLPNIKQHYPKKLSPNFVKEMCKSKQPEFLSLSR